MTEKFQKIEPFDVQYAEPIMTKPLTLEDIQASPVDLLNIFHLIETVTAVPTGVPTKLYDQVKLYTDSLTAPSVYKVYFYITGLNVWKSVALT